VPLRLPASPSPASLRLLLRPRRLHARSPAPRPHP
jgi:hypothetical protein